ncbi:MAG: flippase-like domain-containing protein [Candidatus Aenigmarchaeota archaeon]|nr:flippase-like domain-containing protein [Candidatus Aenigmarchaeota archaeon]
MEKKKAALGIIITIIFLFISFSNIDVGAVLSVMADSDILFVILGSAFYMSSFIFRGLRWKILVRKKINVKLPDSVSYVIIGWAGNNIFPARGGELLRAYVTGKKEKAGTSFSLGTIVVERIFDVFTLVTILILLAFLSPFPEWVRQIILYISAILAAGVIILLILIKIEGGPFRRVKTIRDKTASFILGLKILDRNSIMPIYILSVISWACEILTFYSIGIATGLYISFFVAAFALIIVNIGVVIPSSPGYVGTFQFFCILALGVFSIGNNFAMGFAILVHIAEYVPTTIMGLILLQKQGFSIGKPRKDF